MNIDLDGSGVSSRALLPLFTAAMPLDADSVVGNRKEQELWHGSLPRAILKVETHVVNEGSASQRAAECMIREDVSMFNGGKKPFFP